MGFSDFAVGTGQTLQQLMMKRAIEQRQAEALKAQQDMAQAKLAEDARQYDTTAGLQREKFGADQQHFDATLALNRDKLGVDQQQFEAQAPHRAAQTGFITTQTKHLEEEPLRQEAARQAAEAQGQTHHDYRLGEIAAQGNESRKTAAIRTTSGPGPKPDIFYDKDGKPRAMVWDGQGYREVPLNPDLMGPSRTNKPVSGEERKVVGFFQRMLEAEKNARAVEDKLSPQDVGAMSYVPNWLENWIKTPEGQQYTQAQRTYTEARLRKESGAAIPTSEYENDRATNFRAANDKPETLKQKRASRVTMLRGIGNASGRALQEYYGEGATLDDLLKEFADAPQAAPTGAGGGTVSMVAPDGRRLQVPAEKVAEMEAHGAKRQ